MQQRERHIQTHGMRLLRSLGATVRTLGTTRRRADYQGTMQSPGWPDVRVWFTKPAIANPIAFWWEVKTATGRVSSAQTAFHEEEERAGGTVIVGDLDVLIAFLIDIGRLKPEQVSHEHHGATR